MEREEILRILIDNTGLSMRAFSEKAGIPNTTLYSMLERGIGKASVDNVIKVCKALGITIEQLQDMAKNNNLIPIVGKKDKSLNQIETLAAHFEGDEFTEEDLDDIENFIKYVKSKRKK